MSIVDCPLNIQFRCWAKKMDDVLSVLKFWRRDLEGDKQKTYKFALQNAILSHIKHNQSMVVEFNEISKSLIKQYWNNIIYFGFRETTHENQPPVIQNVLKHFVSISEKFVGQSWFQAKKMEPDLESIILEFWCNSEANSPKKVISNPIQRLQREACWMYNIDGERIVFRQEVFGIVRDLEATLSDLTCLSWANFIEKQNPCIPRVLKKLAMLGNDQERNIPKAMVEFMRTNEPSACFYCERDFRQAGLKEEIDHFVPFSFVFEHSLWNLVRSCKACNCAKSDRIISSESQFLMKLIALNSARMRVHPKIFKNETDFGGDPEGALLRARQFCENSGFHKWAIEEYLASVHSGSS
jgi:hypothetical protein